jgi:peroxiredoxin family protein/rhodanese-related sulfurtransferase/TusA-related sulfurtransferase
MTVYDLEHLELAYAPPYGSAKDPVNVAGFVAANDLRGDTHIVGWDQVDDLLATGEYQLLDVVTEAEYELAHIPGAVNIPNTELRGRLDELSRSTKWLVYCKIGRRGYIAERMLRANGYEAVNLTGGLATYQAATEKQDNLDTWQAIDEEVNVADQLIEAEAAGLPGANEDVLELNACGLQCPGPILSVYKRMEELQEGQVLRVLATDPGFKRDIAAWTTKTGNTLIDVSQDDGTIAALIRKGETKPQIAVSPTGALPNGKTMVVFSGDLDHAMASFVIANGAAAMGQQVTMFFTFWGLNILRRRDPARVNKNLVERMFGWMMPKGMGALKLSRLNMGGMGTAMMKAVMKSKNIDSLESLVRTAQENGVRLIACQMTMDMMGIKPEELIDDVEVGGVATFIGETDNANATLFI